MSFKKFINEQGRPLRKVRIGFEESVDLVAVGEVFDDVDVIDSWEMVDDAPKQVIIKTYLDVLDSDNLVDFVDAALDPLREDGVECRVIFVD